MLRKLIQQTALLFAAQSFSRGAALLSMPFLTHSLSPVEYGIIATLSLFATIFRTVAGLGISAGVGIVYFKQTEKKTQSSVIVNAIALVSTSGLILGISVLCIFAIFNIAIIPGNISVWYAFPIFLFSLWLQLSSEPGLLGLQFRQLAGRTASVYAISTIVNVPASIVLTEYYGLLGWITGQLLGAFATLFTTAFTSFHLVKDGRLLKSITKDLVRIGAPILPGAIAVIGVTGITPIIVRDILGLTQAGIYMVGYQLGLGITLITSAFSAAWYPLFQSYSQNPAEGSKVFPQLTTIYVACFGMIVLLFFVFAKPVLRLTTAESYFDAWIVIGPFAASQFLLAFWGMLLPGLYFAAETAALTKIHIKASIISLLSHYLLLHLFGLPGAGLAAVTASAGLIAIQLHHNRVRRYSVNTMNVKAVSFLMLLLAASGTIISAWSDNLIVMTTVLITYAICAGIIVRQLDIRGIMKTVEL